MTYDPNYECCGCGKKLKTQHQTINHVMHCMAITRLMEREKKAKEEAK